MRKVLISSLGLVLLLSVVGCKKDNHSMDKPAPAMSATKYTCTMHPEVVSDTPGKCPKCGMQLVAKK